MRSVSVPQAVWGPMNRILIAVGAALAFAGSALARPYDEIMKEAQAAYSAEDYAAAAALLDEAQGERPYSLYLTRNRILTRILSGRMDEAIVIAKEIANRGLVLETPAHEAFDRMRAEPAFAPVAARMEANAARTGEKVIAAEFAESGLLPEAISKRSGRLLIGSVTTGEIRNASNGLELFASLDGGVFDIEQTKKAAFAVVNNQLAFEKRAEKPPFAAIVELDPKTGAERRRIGIADEKALLGDLEIGSDETIYASDSVTPRLFIVERGAKDAHVLASDDRFANPQGIALDRKRRLIFMADYLTGLFAIDEKSGAVTAIANPADAHLGGIDGLYLHDGDLIGVQNGTSPQRIVRIRLDKSGTIAERLDVIAQNLEEWNEPTHGLIDGDEFLYIATSNWPAYDDEGNPRDGATPAPLRIMSIGLMPRRN